MIRDIVRMGDPRLRLVARAVHDPRDPEIATLVADMVDTMRGAAGVGLAAPQIGVDLRVMVFGFESNPRYPHAPPVPVTALINPTVEILSDAVEVEWEGCLSIPGLRGLVPRAASILYRGVAPDGAVVEREAGGFHARVVQHELDHLDGILYPDRLVDRTRFGFADVLFPDGPTGEPRVD